MEKILSGATIEEAREKLFNKGAQSLRDLELLTIFLGSVINGDDYQDIAEGLLSLLDKSNGKPSIDDLRKISGIDRDSAVLITSVIELGRRLTSSPSGIKIHTPVDVLPLLVHYADRKQEHFFCVSLNGSNEVIAHRLITIGLVNTVLIHPREVFADAIADRARAIIIAHNHPSGDLEPSNSDIEMTNRISFTGNTIGIDLLDHIIFNHKSFFSFADNGFM